MADGEIFSLDDIVDAWRKIREQERVVATSDPNVVDYGYHVDPALKVAAEEGRMAYLTKQFEATQRIAEALAHKQGKTVEAVIEEAVKKAAKRR